MTSAPTTPALAGFDDRFDDLATTAYRVAYRIVGHREDARDITQEALTRAYARWAKVEAAADAWVARVSTNLALDHVRHRSRRRGRPIDVDRPETHLDIQRLDLVDALRRLPRRQRDVVVLRYLADLPEADVAAALGLAPGTVKSHASRGLAALRAVLDLPATDAAGVGHGDDQAFRPLGAR